MVEDFPVGITFCPHNGSTDLAQTDTMALGVAYAITHRHQCRRNRFIADGFPFLFLLPFVFLAVGFLFRHTRHRRRRILYVWTKSQATSLFCGDTDNVLHNS